MTVHHYANRSILNGKHINIATNYPIPCVSIAENYHGQPSFDHLTSGIDFYIIVYLARHFNFTFKPIHANFKTCSLVNGSIDGICALVNQSVINC